MNRAITALAERWRRDADVLRRHGCAQLADLCEQHAADMLDALQADGDELVTPAEAATLSGYSTRHLRDLGLENHGRRGAPLYRRCDLPCKPGHDPSQAERDAAAALGRMKLAG